MNSTTGDFTDLRRSVVEVETYRISQSVVKKRPRVPRKIVNITPLNWEEIRKELEQGEKEVEKETNSGDENRNIESSVDLKLDESLNDITNRNDIDMVNLETPTKKKDLKANAPSEDMAIKNELKVIHDTPSKEIDAKRNTKENDSFDLNFSALSLVTPVKKVEPTFITPKVQNFEINNTNSVVKFNNFVTPRDKAITMKIQNSAAKTCPRSVRRGLLNNLNPPIEEKEEELIFQKEVPKTIPPEIIMFERLRVKNVEYLVLNKIGKGGSSEVFACFCPEDKKHVAIKCVTLQNQVNAVSFINEVELLQRLQNCEKIIKMFDYEVFEKEKKMLVVLERGGEDLSTILKNIAAQKTHIPFYMLFFYWMEMLYAVKQIHDHGVIHSDLKPANFLKADSGLKLIDFGIASSVQMDMTSVFKTTQEGSCNYISPEALNQEGSPNPSSPISSSAKYKIHYKSDVWSLGCILYQLVYRRTPFHHLHNLWKKLAYIVNPDHVIEFPNANWVPPKIIVTMKKCLQYDVKSRPSVDELINEYENFRCQNCFSSQPSILKDK